MQMDFILMTPYVKRIIKLATIVSFMFSASAAQALVIGTVSHSSNGVVFENDPAFSGLQLGIGLNGAQLFEGISFGLGDVGVTFTANTSNDADFANFAMSATNGVDDIFKFYSNGFFASVGSVKESLRFTGIGFNDPDLFGSTIDSVTIRLNSISISDFYGYTNNLIQWNSTIEFNGSVAAPSTLVLMGLGLLGLIAARAQRRSV